MRKMIAVSQWTYVTICVLDALQRLFNQLTSCSPCRMIVMMNAHCADFTDTAPAQS